ncbi:MAG: ATP-dependent sacrificial sulfur transferase LarE [Euryarchaeota archaeon]|nr:ATP-dependent sacrificial sulfur transferase LarE [Euryarchaeota archaeon]
MELVEKIEKVKEFLQDKNVLVAFSGGADSTLVAKIVKDVGNDSTAVTVDNGVLPPDCVSNAEKIAEKIGIKHIVALEDFLEDESFRSNTPNRCYICKKKMYRKLEEFSKDLGFDHIADGTNISDLLEDRPGIMVNYTKNILSPLVYAGMTSEEVREALKMFDIQYSESTTCFATRISENTELTPKKINRISYAESLIKNMAGVDIVRVRDDKDIARIEVGDLKKVLNKGTLDHIDSELKAVGFKRVTLDIGGYADQKKDLVIYKPCKDEQDKIMFETELPYEINIKDTCEELQKLGDVKCSEKMGIVMLEISNRNVTIFKTGKIVARRVIDKNDAQELLIDVLPHIRRII